MKHLVALAMLAGVAGCGGGGGGSSLPLTLQVSPATFSATYTARGQGDITFTATVTGTVSVPTVYVRVTDGGSTFQPSSLSITQTGPTTYLVSLVKESPLPVGARSGALNVRLCGDLQCGQLLGQKQLPYTVTITADPPLALESIDEIAGSYLAGSPVTVRAVTTGFFAPEKTLYARIEDATGVIVGSGAVAMQHESENVVTATFEISADAVEGRHEGLLSVTVCEDAACTDVLGARQPAYTVDIATLLAGIPHTPGAADGPGATATFSTPYGIAMDGSGLVYVVASGGTGLRKIDADGVVSTVATVGGSPRGVAVASNGAAFVTDASGCVIRRVNPNATVDTVAGFAGNCAASNGLNSPAGLVLDSDASGYVAEPGSHVVRQFVAGTSATTIHAGAYAQPGSANGPAADARFTNPTDVARDSSGNLYVADQSNHVIRKITAAGEVSTFAGTLGQVDGPLEGPAGTARLPFPRGIAIDAGGNLYVSGNGSIRKITPAGETSVLLTNIRLASGQFIFLAGGVAVSADGQKLVVSDPGSHVVLRFTLP